MIGISTIILTLSASPLSQCILIVDIRMSKYHISIYKIKITQIITMSPRTAISIESTDAHIKIPLKNFTNTHIYFNIIIFCINKSDKTKKCIEMKQIFMTFI